MSWLARLEVGMQVYATDEFPADAFQEIEIEIPIRGEEVTVNTRPVVREEVDISKVVRERHQQVTGTVRRERLHVESGRGATSPIDPDTIDGTLPGNASDASIRGRGDHAIQA